MSALNAALYAKFASTNLQSYVGNRIYATRAPEGAIFPYVVFRQVSDDADKTFKENYEDILIQFDLFSAQENSSTEIEQMFEYLIAIFDQASLTITGQKLIYIDRRSATGPFQEDQTTTGGATRSVLHTAVDYQIYTRRT